MTFACMLKQQNEMQIERYETQKKLKIELMLNLHLFQHKKHN